MTSESAEHGHHIRLQDGRVIWLRSQGDAVVIVTPRGEELVLARPDDWRLAETIDWLATRSSD